MIIPARWYSGGKGLDAFRNQMLNDGRISIIHDFAETDLCFPGVNIRGGVCYFLWDRAHSGSTRIYNHKKTGDTSVAVCPLLEHGVKTFIRYNEAISILRKVQALHEKTYDQRVYARNPYGIPSNYSGWYAEKQYEDDLVLYRSRRGSTQNKAVFISKSSVKKNFNLVERYKVVVSKASPGGDEYPHAVFSQPIISEPYSVSTETYLIIDVLDSRLECENLISYISSKFFRFLVSLVKTTQNISKNCFAFVPVQNLNIAWNDDLLYEKYDITPEEADFIDSLIKPMDVCDG